MPRDGVKARPDQMTYERLPGESAKAWQAFRMYRDMGPNRTVNNVRISIGKTQGYSRQLDRWSGTFAWVERAKLYDDWLDSCNRQEQMANAPKWEDLRQQAMHENMALVKKLRQRVGDMLDHPLTKERFENGTDGRNITYILPANWTWGSIATVIKTMAELEAGTISEGLLDEESDAFDPATATLEECRSYIEKLRNRTKNRPPTD